MTEEVLVVPVVTHHKEDVVNPRQPAEQGIPEHGRDLDQMPGERRLDFQKKEHRPAPLNFVPNGVQAGSPQMRLVVAPVQVDQDASDRLAVALERRNLIGDVVPVCRIAPVMRQRLQRRHAAVSAMVRRGRDGHRVNADFVAGPPRDAPERREERYEGVVRGGRRGLRDRRDGRRAHEGGRDGRARGQDRRNYDRQRRAQQSHIHSLQVLKSYQRILSCRPGESNNQSVRGGRPWDGAVPRMAE